MGKDREGKYHPRKGKPSGSLREGAGLQPINTSTIDEQMEIAEKYTDGEDHPAPNVHIRHPNRNVDKREARQRTRDNERSDNAADRSAALTNLPDRSGTEPQELPAMMGKELFSELANYRGEVCATIYMSASVSPGAEANRQKDYLRFKNSLQKLTMVLKEKKMDQVAIDRLLQPGYDLLGDDSFWQGQSKGLAVFISDGYFKYARLPVMPQEEILVNSTFYLTPLIPVMSSREYFYVLVLSKKQAKFYRADAFGMQFISIAGMPRGVDDVVHFEQKDDEDLFRTDTAGAGSGANFHGIGTGRPDHKTDLAMYFDEVDETLWKEVLNRENVPLLLVGVEYLIPIYKQVAKYKPIWDEAITGNHEHEDINLLYEQARAVMEPYFQERVNKALKIYGNQSATELTSSIPDDIIPAAHYGRVSQLFVSKGEHIWGSFDEANNKLTTHAEQQDGDECLVDKSVIKTLLNGGEVFVLPQDKMPVRSKLAASMRY